MDRTTFCIRARLDAATLEAWIEAGYVRRELSEADFARARGTGGGGPAALGARADPITAHGYRIYPLPRSCGGEGAERGSGRAGPHMRSP
jgi:hypothetical protein